MRSSAVLALVAVAGCGAEELRQVQSPRSLPPVVPAPRATVASAREISDKIVALPEPVAPLDVVVRGRTLIGWIADLSSPPLDEGGGAAEQALVEAGEHGADALVAYLRDAGEAPPPIADLRDLLVPRVLALLDDPDAEVRDIATRFLKSYERIGGYGPNDDAVAAAMMRHLREDDAADVLGACGSAATKYVEPLTAALRDPDPETRSAAAWALAEIGRRGSAATGELVRALDDEDAEVRAAAACALGKIGPRASADAARALGELALRDPGSAGDCLTALRDLGPLAAPAVPSLVRLSASDAAETRRLATVVLAGHFASEPDVRRALEGRLDDSDKFTARRAAEALSPDVAEEDDADDASMSAEEESDGPSPVRPEELTRLVEESATWEGRVGAYFEIGRAGADCHGAVVAALAAGGRPPLRAALLRSLANMGAVAAGDVALLRRELRADDVEVRAAAAHSLHALTGDTAAALPALRAFLTEKRFGNDVGYNVMDALTSLRSMGPAAAPAVPEIRRLLRRPQYAATVGQLCGCLGAIGPAAAAAVPELVTVLDGRVASHDWCGSEDNSWMRARAADALGAIGSKDAVPALREALDDPAAGEAARRALELLQR